MKLKSTNLAPKMFMHLIHSIKTNLLYVTFFSLVSYSGMGLRLGGGGGGC
jgi:hypothetical protein